MKLRTLSIFAAVALLAACESAPDNKGAAAGGGAASSQAAPPSSSSAASPMVAPGSVEDFLKNVGDRVFFDFDKYDLKTEGRDQLVKWVAFLKQYPSDTLTVEGHCDERGTREYNLALGERRANSVKDFLAAQGVAVSRLKVISYGKERPAVLGSDEAAWAQNRRSVGVVGQ